MNKLEGLPTIHYISLEESVDRRTNLENWFQKYNITNYVPHLFKRFEEYNYELVGPYTHLLAHHSKGPITSHFCLLKELYETYDDEYFLIVEDDLSLEPVQYWNFTWQEFYQNLPEDWNCVQLVVLREYDCKEFYFEKRKEKDWCAAAYLIKREYVKLLLDLYYQNNYFNLNIKDVDYPPIIELLLFSNNPGVYSFPLFVEDCYATKTSLLKENAHAELINGQGPNHHSSYNNVINWWKNKGVNLKIKNHIKVSHIYQESQFGENWFSYPNLYQEIVRKFPSNSKFVEIGSWKGKSSAFMAVEIANSHKNIEFYCVDTWKGSEEHKDINEDYLYKEFISNMSPIEKYYTPLRMTSIEAAKTFEDCSLDFVFIDASHKYEDVKNDIIAWLPKVKAGGVIAGHDYYIDEYDYFPGVKKAVNEIFLEEELQFQELCWRFDVKKSLKILFYCIDSKDKIWEYDFIHNDIIGNSFVKKDYFLSNYENINENFDILVYFCRDQNNYFWGHVPSYDEILNCVKKIKPKIIIQLSDEFNYEDLHKHNELGNYCQIFLRQYHHSNYEYTDNTIIMPLGYTNGCKKFNYDKEYDFSFFGEIKRDRRDLLLNFISRFSNFLTGTNISKEDMCKAYSKSYFVPCGRGNSSLNCFRLYESSMNNAIPVIVGDKEEIKNTFKYEESPPWITADTWENASIICQNLLNNNDKLQEKQKSVFDWWINRVTKIKKKVNQILITN
jgi:GR25 family glycosyltransferase involved in LPS biosynthesis